MSRWWWFDEPTPAVRSLHRALSRACGWYLALVGVATLAWTALFAGGGHQAVVTAIVGALTAVVGLVTTQGSRALAIPAGLTALAVLAQLAGESFGSPLSPVSVYLVLGVALLAPTQLRTAPAALTAAVAIVALVLAVPEDVVVYTIEMQMLTIGTVIAEIAFLRILFQSAHGADEVARRRHDAEVARTTAASDVAALAEVRAVLHDDVVGTLVLLGHERMSPDDARQRAADSLARLRALERR